MGDIVTIIKCQIRLTTDFILKYSKINSAKFTNSFPVKYNKKDSCLKLQELIGQVCKKGINKL